MSAEDMNVEKMSNEDWKSKQRGNNMKFVAIKEQKRHFQENIII
jgi:hypothetical protein